MSDTKKKKLDIISMVMCALFAAIIGVLSQVAIPLPTGVPVTLQTFAVALCGYYLKTAKATIAAVVYVAVGALGAPVFANFKGGFASLISPAGGFLFGFIAMAAICGITINALPKAAKPACAIGFGILGLSACHIAGVIQYSIVMSVPLGESFMLVSLSFLIKDIASVVAAYLVTIPLLKATASVRKESSAKA